MILLDTNVVSELMKAAPDSRVEAWIAAAPATSLFISAITQAEILYGIAVLPAGRRKDALAEAVAGLLQEDFRERILAFDSAAAAAYADIAAGRRRLGRPIAQLDAQIGAIARSRGAMLATRNAADFEHVGIAVTNPWANA